MNKYVCILMAVLLLLAFYGCTTEKTPQVSPAPTETAAPTSPPSTPSPQLTSTPAAESEEVSVMAISDHTLKSPVVKSMMTSQQWPYLIAAYKKNCAPITLDENNNAHISFDIGISDYNVIYICPLNDGYGETTSYIDLFLQTEYNAAAKTLQIDCAPLVEDECGLWSFLIWATDESENEFLYYTRVAA